MTILVQMNLNELRLPAKEFLELAMAATVWVREARA